MIHEIGELNRYGQVVNDEYMTPACNLGMDGEPCISAACCCVCHAGKTTNPVVIPLSKYNALSGDLLSAIDGMILSGLVVIDRSHPNT